MNHPKAAGQSVVLMIFFAQFCIAQGLVVEDLTDRTGGRVGLFMGIIQMVHSLILK